MASFCFISFTRKSEAFILLTKEEDSCSLDISGVLPSILNSSDWKVSPALSLRVEEIVQYSIGTNLLISASLSQMILNATD